MPELHVSFAISHSCLQCQDARLFHTNLAFAENALAYCVPDASKVNVMALKGCKTRGEIASWRQPFFASLLVLAKQDFAVMSSKFGLSKS